MPKKFNLLLVEDSRDDAQLIVSTLQGEGLTFEWERVQTAEALTTALERVDVDIVLADYQLPQFTGLEALRVVRDRRLDVPVIVISGTLGEETAADIMRAGARDFVVKDRLGRLAAAVRRELVEAAMRRERRSAEAELMLQQQRFQALVEKSSEVIAVIDREGAQIYGSPSIRQVLGYAMDEFVGRSVFDFIHPEDLGATRETLASVIGRSAATDRQVLRYRHKDGRWLRMEVTATNLLDDPAIRGVVFNYHDVTERRAAVEALLDREALYRATFDEAPVGIGHASLEGRILRVNQEYARLFGYSIDELLRLDVKMLAEASEVDRDRGDMESLLRGACTAVTREKRYRRKDGRQVWANRTLSLRRDGHGRPLHYIAIVEDITQRREAERSLRELQERFQAILDHSPALIYLKDAQRRYILANRICEEKFAPGGVGLLGRVAEEVLPPAAAAAERQHDEAALVAETAVTREIEIPQPDGRHVYLSHKFLLRDASGSVTGVGGVAIDVTERKSMQQQLLQAQKMEAFGQLAGGVAHDFNNILAILLMHLNMMPIEAELPAKTRSTLKELEQVINRATSIVRQLLIFSRKHEMAKQTVDLNQTVAAACKMLQRFVGEDIAFRFEPSGGPLWTEADAGMIEQVLMNLCVNARDAMPRGGSLSVTVIPVRARNPELPECEPERDYVALSVADTGLGMDEATRRRIFEPFFTTKPVGRGTGLGLATVHGIAKQHGGWVEVQSEPQVGSVFCVYLPAGRAPQVQELSMSDGLQRGTGRVLLVEDEEMVRASTASCLRLAGYEVTEAENAIDAAEQWAVRGPHDVLLTDMVMPHGVTGAQLADRLARENPDLKVIVMTGYGGHSPAERESPLPPHYVRIMKPFPGSKLLEVLAALLQPR